MSTLCQFYVNFMPKGLFKFVNCFFEHGCAPKPLPFWTMLKKTARLVLWATEMGCDYEKDCNSTMFYDFLNLASKQIPPPSLRFMWGKPIKRSRVNLSFYHFNSIPVLRCCSKSKHLTEKGNAEYPLKKRNGCNLSWTIGQSDWWTVLGKKCPAKYLFIYH